MNLLDRLFVKKQTSPVEPTDLGFCTRCGKPMVKGYLIGSKGFDKRTGRAVVTIHEGVMCTAMDRQERSRAYFASHDGAWPTYEADGRTVWADELP